MPRSATLFIALVLLAPATARAKFQLRIESASWFIEPNRLTLDVFAEPTDDEDEQLGGYDLALRLVPVNASPAGGLGFAPPYAVRPAEGFVFGTPELTNYTYNVPPNGPPAAGPTQFILNVESTGAGPINVASRVKIAEVVLEVQPGTLPTQYRVEINQQITNFGSLDPNRLDPTVEYTVVTGDGSGIINIVPEPASLSLLALGGLLALRRRRVA